MGRTEQGEASLAQVEPAAGGIGFLVGRNAHQARELGHKHEVEVGSMLAIELQHINRSVNKLKELPVFVLVAGYGGEQFDHKQRHGQLDRIFVHVGGHRAEPYIRQELQPAVGAQVIGYLQPRKRDKILPLQLAALGRRNRHRKRLVAVVCREHLHHHLAVSIGIGFEYYCVCFDHHRLQK